MIQVFKDIYRNYFSDPQAAILSVLIVVGFSIIILMGDMLLPVFASIVIAYLLDDVVAQLVRHKVPRLLAVWLAYMIFIAVLVLVIFGLVPLLSKQISSLVRELPQILAAGQQALASLPENYPIITEQQLAETIRTLQQQLTGLGQKVVSFSLTRIPSLITAGVYLVLMPLLVFFFMKDKDLIIKWGTRFLPRERALMSRVWEEMDRQLGNYVRGKFWELLIVGLASGIAFSIVGLNYAMLLGALIGLSVIIPYIGAVVVTIPVVVIAWFQWGWAPEFAYVLAIYLVIQALDGVVLVPLMFSEVVNLHPIAIIVAVLVFGGLWGFWGVFFAIPLATFVQALISAWPQRPGSAGEPANAP